jgi:hypothetical protein
MISGLHHRRFKTPTSTLDVASGHISGLGKYNIADRMVLRLAEYFGNERAFKDLAEE